MATAPDMASLPPAAERTGNFEQGVACALNLWPALTLSVQNGWGGPDSVEKRDWFAGAIVDLFPEYVDGALPSPEEADVEDVETVLLQVMVDEFDVNVDDDSAYELATQIIGLRTQCAIGEFQEVLALQRRFAERKGAKVDQMFKKAEDPNQDTDGDSDDSDDDDDDDVEMGDAPSAPREKQEPQVDEDGFTLVTKKK